MKPTVDKALKAIRAKCMDCSGNSRREVEQCRIKDCPLYPYRSVKAIGGGDEHKLELDGQIGLFEVMPKSERKIAMRVDGW